MDTESGLDKIDLATTVTAAKEEEDKALSASYDDAVVSAQMFGNIDSVQNSMAEIDPINPQRDEIPKPVEMPEKKKEAEPVSQPSAEETPKRDDSFIG